MEQGEQFALQEQVCFDDFELHPREALLLHRGRKLRLQPQPFRVLAYLVARSPAIVSREELGEQIWQGVHVDLDQSLNYCIRQIRQALDDSASLPRFVETLPRQGYRFTCPVRVSSAMPVEARSEPAAERAGVPAPLAESPPSLPNGNAAFSAVDLAVPPEMDSAGSRIARVRPWALRAALLGTLVLVALLVVAVRHRFGASARAPNIKSLAVLPIDNLSGDPAQDYLADGMTDELTTMLARESTLRVVSRTSVMQYRGARHSLPEVARQLGVDAIVEGSLARSGTRTHVTLQLIRADTDSHLWAESYDRDVNDATVPDQAARSIAKRLNSASEPPQPIRFIAPAAHEAYLHGRYLWPTDRLEEAGAYFKKATEIQPDYAEAWAGLSNSYGEGIAGGMLDPRTSIRPEEEAADRALALAPKLALAHQAMAAVYLIGRWDAKSADREILLAISLDPNDAETFYLRACVLQALRRFPEAIQVEKKSMEMDPFERREGLASIYLGARLFDEALADIKLRMETAPDDPGLLWTEAEAWRSKGNYKEATEAWVKLFVATKQAKSAADLRRAYEARGAEGFLRWQLKQRLLEAKEHYVSPVAIASYYAQLGDKEHALPLLEEGYRQRSTDFLWIADDPAYDFLQADSRYQGLLEKLKLISAP